MSEYNVVYSLIYFSDINSNLPIYQRISMDSSLLCFDPIFFYFNRFIVLFIISEFPLNSRSFPHLFCFSCLVFNLLFKIQSFPYCSHDSILHPRYIFYILFNLLITFFRFDTITFYREYFYYCFLFFNYFITTTLLFLIPLKFSLNKLNLKFL